MIDLHSAARALGGEVSGGEILFPPPGHSRADRSASLKFTKEAPEGFVVHSFANDDVLAIRDYVKDRLGIRRQPHDHGTNGAKAQRPRIVAEYIYKLADGTPYLKVCRTDPKGPFPQFHWTGSGWAPGKPKGPKVPYKLPELLAAVHDTVMICEGERDADRLEALGFVATTASEGAGKWTSDLNRWFKGKTAFVLEDNDDAGRKHASQVAENLSGIATEVRIVSLPGLPEKGDITDWLEMGGDPRSLVDVCRTFPIWTPANDANVANEASRESVMARLGISTAASLLGETLPEARYVIPGYIGEGLTLLAGAGKIGKSWMGLGFGIAVSTPGGVALGGVPVEHGDALILALEDNKRRMQRRLLKMLPNGRKPERLHIAYEWRSFDAGGIDDLRAWLEHVAQEPKLVIVDVIEKVRPRQGKTESLYAYDYRSLSPLKALADEFNVAIVGLHHTNKGTFSDPFDCVSGSKGLTAAADSALVLTRDGQGAVLYGRGRDIEEFETAVVFDGATGAWTATGSAEEVRRSSERKAILEILKKAGRPMSPADVAAATQMKVENVRFLFFKMANAGEVVRCGRGQYTLPTPTNVANDANVYRFARDEDNP